MDWNDLRKVITTRLQVTRDEPDSLRAMRGKLEIKAQRVGDLFVLLASMGVVRALSPQAALELNNQIIHGALALEGQTYVMRRITELSFLDAARAEQLLDKFAAEAQKIHEGLTALSAPATTAAARDVALGIWAA